MAYVQTPGVYSSRLRYITCIHLEDAFIQSDLQYRYIRVSSGCILTTCSTS